MDSIHTLSAEDVKSGILNKPSIRKMSNYRSINGAVKFFIENCYIIGLEDFLPKELHYKALDDNQLQFDLENEVKEDMQD